MIEMAQEHGAMLDRFETVVERWGLTEEELTFLLGMDRPGLPICDVRSLIVDETSVRLLVELNGLLTRRMSADAIRHWLRAETADGPDPLTFMSLSLQHLRAIVVAARMRDETVPG